MVAGVKSSIGYASAGTPLYQPNAKVNQDIAAVGKKFPLEEGWVILTTPPYPDKQSVFGPEVLRMVDDMRTSLLHDPKVAQVEEFSSTVSAPFNELFHYGYPKYLAVPDSQEMSGNLWFLFINGSAPGELERYISNRISDDTCIRVLLRGSHLRHAQRDSRPHQAFVAERVTPDPALSKVKVLLRRRYRRSLPCRKRRPQAARLPQHHLRAGGRLDVLSLFVPLVRRRLHVSVRLRLANFGAFIYMNFRRIGLTIDTIPVISLGIGLGVDYGIYMIARIRDEVMGGMEVDDAIVLALKTTGVAVFNTFLVMIGGIFPWIFSPLLFHSQMSTLLIFLMGTNMIAGCIILPCYLSWARPKFVFGGASMIKDRELKAAVS